MMLVLSRKLNEAVVIGHGIVVRVNKIAGGRVRLAIDAPPEVSVDREEVHYRKKWRTGRDPAVLAGEPHAEDVTAELPFPSEISNAEGMI